MLSGTGEVSKDCSKTELDSWAEVLARWSVTSQHPRQLSTLVKQGIPEALRGEVWQRLAQCDQDNSLMDTYRILITKVLPDANEVVYYFSVVVINYLVWFSSVLEFRSPTNSKLLGFHLCVYNLYSRNFHHTIKPRYLKFVLQVKLFGSYHWRNLKKGNIASPT